MGQILCKHNNQYTSDEVIDIIKTQLFGNEYNNKVFVDKWNKINPKKKIDKFGILYTYNPNKMFYLLDRNIYVIHDDQTYKIPINSKQYLDIVIKRKF